MPTNRSWWQWLTGWPGAGLALVAALAVAFLVHPGQQPGAPLGARAGAGQALAQAPATQPATTAPAPASAAAATSPPANVAAPTPAAAPAPAASPPANRLPTQITFKTLSNFTYDPPERPIPQTVRALNGQRVRLAGFMIPLDIEDGKAKQFIMLASIPGCLYCQPPQLNEMVAVTLTGAGIEPSDQPLAATGTLAVGEERQDGAVVSLFRLQADDVQAVTTP